MKIQIIKPVCCKPWNLSALVNDVIEVDDKQANALIDAKVAEKTEKPLFPIDEVSEEVEKPKKGTKEAK